MQIAYYDESGDDGFPKYSSPIFVLTTLYLHDLNWKGAYENIRTFRQQMKSQYGVPVKLEMHAKQFLLNKKPYRKFNLNDEARLSIFDDFCDFIGSLNIKIINVAILKPRIQNQNYNVLDWALKASVQRLENDIDPARNPRDKLMIITDEGRVGKMRQTTRRIQRINYIPSRYSHASYRQEIRCLIEDPLPKDSKESYFIQLADVVAYTVYLHALKSHNIGDYANRLPASLDEEKVINWLDLMKPSLNERASGRDEYGIVFLPR